MAEDLDALVERMRANPDDSALWEPSLRAMFSEGAHARAVELLAEQHAFLAGHDGEAVACLCRKCMRSDQPDIELKGMPLTRDFVMVGRRVLFFWRPTDMTGVEEAMRRAVRDALAERLAKSDGAKSDGAEADGAIDDGGDGDD